MSLSLLEGLAKRQATPKLKAPAPEGEVWREIKTLALNVPDHARLKPWRFLEVRDERRKALGALLAQAAQVEAAKNGEVFTQAEQQKFENQPLRAPLIVVVVASYQAHEKVPHLEQANSAACCAHNILLASQAHGFAGIWRTGLIANHDVVKRGLGLEANEEVIGFLYIGTADSTKPQPEFLPEQHWQSW